MDTWCLEWRWASGGDLPNQHVNRLCLLMLTSSSPFFQVRAKTHSIPAPANGVTLPSKMTLAPFLPRSTCPAAAKQETLTNGHALPRQPLANGHSETNSPQNHTIEGDSTPLRALCTRLNAQITTFLHEDVKSEKLKATQAQTRISLQIIQEALDRYPQVTYFSAPRTPRYYLLPPCVNLTDSVPRHQPTSHLPFL